MTSLNETIAIMSLAVFKLVPVLFIFANFSSGISVFLKMCLGFLHLDAKKVPTPKFKKFPYMPFTLYRKVHKNTEKCR
jgi:hypothetical protein